MFNSPNLDSIFYQPQNWVSKVGHIVLFIALLIPCIILQNVSKTIFSQIFYEQDPAISYPFKHSQVSNTMLGATSILFPVPFILFAAFAPNKYFPNTRQGHLEALFWFSVTLGIILTSTSTFSNSIKLLVGGARPSLYGICNYAHFNDNQTYYELNTKVGAIGDFSKCVNQDYDALMTFPSGHSSLTFASMIYIVFLLHFTEIWCALGRLTVKILTVLVLSYAMWVGITRIQDYKHHSFDVLSGAVLGSAITVMWWHHIKGLFELNIYLDGVKEKKSEAELSNRV